MRVMMLVALASHVIGNLESLVRYMIA
jgi:hypothetical protein